MTGLLKGRKLGQEPERFVEDHLIFPILETLGHSVLARPVQYAPRWTHGRGIPDFALTTIPIATAKEHDIRLFGEAKPPNKLHYARDDVTEYLKKILILTRSLSSPTVFSGSYEFGHGTNH